MLMRAALLGAVSALALTSHAHAAVHGSAAAAPAGCVYPTFAADGCAGAQANGSFKTADLFTYAAQSGQTWTSHHPQPWNLPGVDYYIGNDPSLTYRDPKIKAATLASESGCTYSDTTGPNSSPQVTCSTNAKGKTLERWDFTGVIGGENCVKLRLTNLLNSSTGMTIKNNKFKASGGCLVTNGNLISVESSSNSKFPIRFLYNDIDGNSDAFVHKGTYTATFAGTVMTVTAVGVQNWGSKILKSDLISGTGIVGDFSVSSLGTGTGGVGTYNMNRDPGITGPITITDGASPAGAVSWQNLNFSTTVAYNYFHNIFNLPMIGNQTDSDVLTYSNFVDGFNEACITAGCLHGAYWEILNDGGNLGTTRIQHSYNVLLMRNTNAGGVTAPITFLSPHAGANWKGVTYDAVQIDHNTTIINLAADGDFSGSGALSYVAYLKYIGTWTQQDNYVDPWGARDCVENFGGISKTIGFVDNAGGGAAGNTLTITGIDPVTGGGLWTGSYVSIFGVTPDRLVLPAGTICDGQVSTGGVTASVPGGGSTGTYCIDGPAVGRLTFTYVGSTSHPTATKTTPMGLVVFGGAGHENKSLSDGSTITRAGNSWNSSTAVPPAACAVQKP